MKVKPYIILNRSRKHVNYDEDKNKVTMNKPYNIQIRIFAMVFSIFHFLKHYYNGIFHISFFKALLINEGETTRMQGELTPTAFTVFEIRLSNVLARKLQN
jgi:hypothetical protein